MKKLMMLAILLCTGIAFCACRKPKRTKARTAAATNCMTDKSKPCTPCEVKSTPMKDSEVRSKCCGKCKKCCGKSSCNSCCKTSCCKNCCRTPEVTVTPRGEPTDPDRKCSKCNCGCANCSCKSGETEDETSEEAARVVDPVPTPMPRP